MSVRAVLNVASTATATSTTIAKVAPAPAPAALVGSPTGVVFGLVTDLANSRMQFSYLVYQTYSTDSGTTGMAQATGTTAWVPIPNVSHDFPEVSVSIAPASELSGNSVEFTLTGTVSYTQTTPGIYTVTTE